MRSCLICDDHAIMREALAGLVRLNWPAAELTLVADFPTAFQAITRRPELCLCDLSMPGADPVDGIRRLKALSPTCPVLVITASEDDALLVTLFREGIAGFVSKTSRTALIEAAIRVTLAGGQYVPPRILELAGAAGAGNGVRWRGSEATPPASRLTERQTDVLRQIARGRSNKEIARDLGLSPATVKAHVAALLGVLGATNRTEAVVLAEKAGLI